MISKRTIDSGLTVFNAVWKAISIACTVVSAGFLVLWAAGVEAARAIAQILGEIGPAIWELAWSHWYLTLPFLAAILMLAAYFFKTRRARRLFRACLFAYRPNSRWRAWIECLRVTMLLKWPPSARQAQIFVESRLIVRELWETNWASADAESEGDGAANAPSPSQKIDAHRRIIEELQIRLRSIDQSPLIMIENCPSLIEKRSELEEYLAYIKANTYSTEPKTICRVHIRDGFFAPIFLVAGLVEAFQQNWAPIISSFDPLVREYASPISRDFEAFRQFQFNCWLLWGPSIPVCSCGEWSDYTAHQFGFGDENNSIDVMMASGPESASRIQTKMRAGKKDRGVSAISARVQGQLMLPEMKRDRIGRSQRAILCDVLNKDEPKRVALMIEKPQDDLLGPESDHIENFYYSAYIWVMFVLCKSDGTPLHATDFEGRKEANWRNLAPFFVHGNIADEATYDHHKKMLARQICETVKDVLAGNPLVILTFVCAFDESGCDGDMLWRSDLRSQSNRNLILSVIAGDRTLQALVEAGRLRMSPPSTGAEALHKYSSCFLPGIVLKYYRELKLRRSGLMAEPPAANPGTLN